MHGVRRPSVTWLVIQQRAVSNTGTESLEQQNKKIKEQV